MKVSFPRQCVSRLDACVEQMIGFTLPPVHRAIAEADWEADAQVDYCHRCGDSVAAGERTDAGCSTCRDGAELSGGLANGIVRLGTYTDALQSWIQMIKFNGWAEMADELGTRLGSAVQESRMVEANCTIVIPMPMPLLRRMHRRFDHSRTIAIAAARELRSPLVPVLSRAMYTPQVLLPPSMRKRSGSHGLRVRHRLMWDNWVHVGREWVARSANRQGPLRGLHVVLVDDVRTTGSTLKAAARLLRTLKPERIVCAVLAVSDSRARQIRSQQSRAERSDSLVNPESNAAPYNPPLASGSPQPTQ